MTRTLVAFALALAALTAPAAQAQDAKAPDNKAPAAKIQKSSSAPKIGKDQKVCRYRFPTGKLETWVCAKEQPCCAWDAINYVKCGSTITGCF